MRERKNNDITNFVILAAAARGEQLQHHKIANIMNKDLIAENSKE